MASLEAHQLWPGRAFASPTTKVQGQERVRSRVGRGGRPSRELRAEGTAWRLSPRSQGANETPGATATARRGSRSSVVGCPGAK